MELSHTTIRSAASSIQELKERGFLIGIGAVTRSAQAREARVFGKESVELLRVLQEALTNARRHSEARNVELTLRTEDKAVLAEVADDGRGFDPGSARAGIGLSAMRERIEALGGKIEVRSRPGEGTRVGVRVPLREDTLAPRRL